jgi:hypothetical protein
MPFVLIVVAAFLLAMVLGKGPSRGLYVAFVVAAAAAAWYFMR